MAVVGEEHRKFVKQGRLAPGGAICTYAVFNVIIMIAQWESCHPFSLGCRWRGRDVKHPPTWHNKKGGQESEFPDMVALPGAHPALWMGVRHRGGWTHGHMLVGGSGTAACLALVIHSCLQRPCVLQAVYPVCRHKQPAELPPSTNRLTSKSHSASKSTEVQCAVQGRVGPPRVTSGYKERSCTLPARGK